MTRLFAIARNAFIETIRQPIFGILIMVTLGILALDVPLSGWTMGRGQAEYAETDQMFLITMGLSTLLVAGLFCSAFSAGGVLSRMIEDRTILTVVSKPVARPIVVLGTYLGVTAAIMLAYYIEGLGFLMTVRHGVMPTVNDPVDIPVVVLGCSALGLSILAALFCNYFFGWSFASAAVGIGTAMLTIAMGAVAVIGKEWTQVPFGQGIHPDILMSMLVGTLCLLVFSAVAVAASTRLGLIMTLLVCCGFFVTGLKIDELLGAVADRNPLLQGLYWAWPKLSFFYMLDVFFTRTPIPWSYVGMATAYAACATAAILAIGMLLFQRHELEAPTGGSAETAGMVMWLARLGRLAAVVLALAALYVPGPYSLIADLGLGAGLLALAAAMWMFWGLFGRGARWTYLVAFGATIVGLAVAGVLLAVRWNGLAATQRVQMALPLAAGLAIVIILLLPKTRFHFSH